MAWPPSTSAMLTQTSWVGFGRSASTCGRWRLSGASRACPRCFSRETWATAPSRCTGVGAARPPLDRPSGQPGSLSRLLGGRPAVLASWDACADGPAGFAVMRARCAGGRHPSGGAPPGLRLGDAAAGGQHPGGPDSGGARMGSQGCKSLEQRRRDGSAETPQAAPTASARDCR